MTILNLPKHRNPEEDRRSTAPYNFVPLPEKVVTAVNDPNAELPNHDTYDNPEYPHTGYFDVTLTTKSPLYVRGMLTRTEFDLDEQGKDRHGRPVQNGVTRIEDKLKNKPDFFHTGDASKPVIPGSSLRGMIRSLVEIVSYGKISRVSDKKLFFRTMDDSAVGDYYRGRMSDRVETGFLLRKGRQYGIRKCSMARVFRDDINTDLYETIGSDKIPCWKSTRNNPVQYRPVWVLLNEKGDRVKEIGIEKEEGWLEGRLVITGNIPKKKKEFVFLLPASDAEEIAIPEAIIQRFHDDDQITTWQEKAFPVNKPQPGYRERDGWLGKKPNELGEPVFFLREDNELTFIGRARMFRLPYAQRPLDLVNESLRDIGKIDFADAMLGYVEKKRSHAKQGEKANAYASRLRITDAITDATDVFLPSSPFTPEILATPKPTAFQHYLVQKSDSKRSLKHYGSSPDETAIRGAKRYWMRGDRTITQLRAPNDTPATSTQHTRMKPVRSGVSFTFRIYFENLSKEELGALCWALHPLGESQKTYCHQIGMGKPLGMGAVKLEATLHLNKRKERYESLFDGAGWATGYRGTGLKLSERAEEVKSFTDAFEAHIRQELQVEQRCSRLAELKRIAMLLKMMEWEDHPPATLIDCARTQTLEEFKERRVLPDPSFWIPDSERNNLVEPTPPQNPSDSGAAQTRTGGHAKPQSQNKAPQSGIGNTLTATKQPLATASAKPHSAREKVKLVGNIKNGRARVETLQGEQITCEKMPTTAYSAPKSGDEVWASVERGHDGKAVSARYLPG
jgi:CRISPR-associated protein (TIGR03986 family)